MLFFKLDENLKSNRQVVKRICFINQYLKFLILLVKLLTHSWINSNFICKSFQTEQKTEKSIQFLDISNFLDVIKIRYILHLKLIFLI